MTRLGRYFYTLLGWVDAFGSWRHELARCSEQDPDLAVVFEMGAALVAAAAARAAGTERKRLEAIAAALRGRADAAEKRALALAEQTAALMARYAERRFATRYDKELAVVVERERARIPDPNDPRTFDAARLRWEDREAPGHREWLALHRRLLALCAREIVLRLRGLTRNEAHWERLGERALAVRWRHADGARLVLLANLSPPPAIAACRPPAACHRRGRGGLGHAAGRTGAPWSVAAFLEAEEALDEHAPPPRGRLPPPPTGCSSTAASPSGRPPPSSPICTRSASAMSTARPISRRVPAARMVTTSWTTMPSTPRSAARPTSRPSWPRSPHTRDMGHLLEMVPNHMGVGGDDNPW